MARTNNVQHLLFARVNIRAQILSLCSLSAGAGRELDARASSAQQIHDATSRLTRDAGPKTTHSGVFSASPRKARAGPTS